MESNYESGYEYEKTQESESKNLCITCKRDMGPDNPRQLCGKYQCDYEDEMEADLEDIPIEEQISKEKTNQNIKALFANKTILLVANKVDIKKISELPAEKRVN